MVEGTQKTSMVDFILSRRKVAAERERIAKQKYQQEYEGGQQALPWELKNLLDSLGGLAYGEIVNELTKMRGDLVVVQQRTPGVCVAIVGLVSRRLKLTRPDVETWLDLPLPMQHDALDTLLLNTLRGLEPEVKNGTLSLARIADVVNADRTEHEALSHKLIVSRLHALGFLFTRGHPPRLIWNRSLLFPSEVNVAAPFVPPLVESSTHENGSLTHTQNTQ